MTDETPTGEQQDTSGIETESVNAFAPAPEPEAAPEPEKPEPSKEEPSEPPSEEASEGEGEEPQNKGKSAKQRIGELTAKRREAERAAEAERQANTQRQEQLRQALQPQPGEASDDAPKPEDYDGGEFDPKFIADLVDYKAEEKARSSKEQLKKELHQEQASADFNQRVSNFYEGLQTNEEHGPAAFELVTDPNVKFSAEMSDIILTSENGAAIAAHLNENRAELSRISALPAHMQAFELASIGRTPPAQAAKTPAPKPRTTKAPDPLPEATGSKARATKDPSKMSSAEYEKWANEREARGRSAGW